MSARRLPRAQACNRRRRFAVLGEHNYRCEPYFPVSHHTFGYKTPVALFRLAPEVVFTPFNKTEY